MTTTDEWTLGQLLSWTTDYLKKHGSDSPRLDAEVLLAYARKCERIELYTDFGQLADQLTRESFRNLVKRRAEGVPVAHLVGYREFYSMSFRVTPDVLIPRPETELIVVTLLDLIKQRPEGRNLSGIEIADVGTGSGVLAVCAAKHVPDCRVTAIDASQEALTVAEGNATFHGVQSQIQFVLSDLLELAKDEFDYIMSNPPYVSEPEFDELQDDVRCFEPRDALVAGPSGTEVIARLIPQAADQLRRSGWLLLEISPMIQSKVEQLFAVEDRFDSCRFVKDLSGKVRMALAQRK